MFLPTTLDEVKSLGWRGLDIILVTGDSYIDSPFIGVAVIGKVLVHAGFRVGIIAQPDTEQLEDIGRLGQPDLFWGVTAGSIDSMVANYTALKKRRKSDDYTPGGLNTRRPDRASIVYTNMIRRLAKRQSAKSSPPIVLGGIEASLRRIAHYDFWSDRIRGSILFDAKADYLLYGMAELSVLEFAACLREGQDPRDIRGLCYATKTPPEEYDVLPDFETAAHEKDAFIDMFHAFYRNNDPITGRGLIQRHGDRYLVQNPPARSLTQKELDGIYSLKYERAQHPYYEREGKVRAPDTITFSISTHRGCYGECNFCAIGVHEGRTVQWRSETSILAEARELTEHPRFRGNISDVGGPTANMYGFECDKKLTKGMCEKKRCVFPRVCRQMKIDHGPQTRLLRRIREIPGIKKVFVASGIRYDMIFADEKNGDDYLKALVSHHVSGQLKVAPEHSEDDVLRLMGKPGIASLLQFKKRFDELSRTAGKAQFLTYYMVAAHPGCTEEHMRHLRRFAGTRLRTMPEQVQIFTPTPSTYSSVMYCTGLDPFTHQPIFVERNPRRRERQKEIITGATGTK